MPLYSDIHDGRCDARIAGELSIYTVSAVKDEMAALLEAQAPVELALDGVTEFDSAGVQLLLWLKRELSARGRSLHIPSVSAPVSDALLLLGLAGFIGYDPSSAH